MGFKFCQPYDRINSYVIAHVVFAGVLSDTECPNGWTQFRDSCYLFVVPTADSPAKTWEDARINCLGYGAVLAPIHHTRQTSFIRRHTFAF